MRLPKDATLALILQSIEVTDEVRLIVDEFKRELPKTELILTNSNRSGDLDPRNSVLEAAIQEKCDRLAFVEADQIVDPEWLRTLIATQSENQLALVGGPIDLLWPMDKIGFRQKIMLKGVSKLVRRRNRIGRKSTHYCRRPKAPVATENWLFDVAFFRESGLRFNGSFGIANGLDSIFTRDFQDAGGLAAWEPKAVIYFYSPITTLNLKYQFDRGRDEALLFHSRRPAREGKVTGRHSGRFIATKLLLGTGQMLRGILDGGKSFVLAASSFGMVAGRLDGLRGKAYNSVVLPDLD